jgi:hypothetical protein
LALGREAKATPDAAPVTEAQEPSGDAVPESAARPMPGTMSWLVRAALAILVAIVVGVLLFNRLPWQSVANGTPAATSDWASPPESLVRATREGVVAPRDYFRVWRQSGTSAISAEDGMDARPPLPTPGGAN